jgi:hypothetical protein
MSTHRTRRTVDPLVPPPTDIDEPRASASNCPRLPALQATHRAHARLRGRLPQDPEATMTAPRNFLDGGVPTRPPKQPVFSLPRRRNARDRRNCPGAFVAGRGNFLAPHTQKPDLAAVVWQGVGRIKSGHAAARWSRAKVAAVDSADTGAGR